MKCCFRYSKTHLKAESIATSTIVVNGLGAPATDGEFSVLALDAWQED